MVSVTDGDTIKVLHNGNAEKIRLYGIDCPEKKQAYGKKAKQFTPEMVFKQTVDIKPVATDRYGRTIGLVYINVQCFNEELIRAGFAWVYIKLLQEDYLY